MGPRTLGRSGSVAEGVDFVSGVVAFTCGFAVCVGVAVGDADGVAVAVGSTDAGFTSVLFDVVGAVVAVGSDVLRLVSELTCGAADSVPPCSTAGADSVDIVVVVVVVVVVVAVGAGGNAGPPTPNGPAGVVPSARPIPSSCSASSIPTGMDANRCRARAIGFPIGRMLAGVGVPGFTSRA